MEIGALLDMYDEAPPVIEVPVAGGVLTFATMKDASVMWRVEKDAIRFSEMVAKPEACLAEWRQWLPVDAEVATMVWRVHALSHEPKITIPEALRMARVAGTLVATINGAIAQSLNVAATAEAEAIERLGEPSRPIG